MNFHRRLMSSKLRSAFLLLMSLLISLPGFAFADKETPEAKPTPFAPKDNNAFSALALPNGEIGNEHIQANIGTNGRFNMGIKKQQSGDEWYNIIYSWPSYPNTSFTTVKVDGTDRVYGLDAAGYTSFVTAPHNVDDTTNEALWKMGDVSVKQVLQTALNPATGIPDAFKIRYTITNAGTQNHSVGLRMMVDTMVEGNDHAPFRVPTAGGIESVDYEKDYFGQQVPGFWQAFKTFENPDISAQYTMKGSDATAPDRFTIASWSSINNTLWDYNITANRKTGDSAVGMWWNPTTLAPGETRTIVTYYGRPGVGGDQTLVLSGRQRLSYPEWSTSPSNLIAYLNNNLGMNLSNVTLQLVPGDNGLSLVDGDAVHDLGNIPAGTISQTTWRVKPTAEGVHPLTVKAFREGAADPFATATYEIEALAPVVPPNVSIGGGRGSQNDGTPVAGRTTPLTVNASFNNPSASAVKFVATDATGDKYEAQMSTQNGIDWTISFIPSQAGLWETPLEIEIVPTYPGNQTGPPLEFEVVLIDPSGIVYNAAKGNQNDWPLPRATVVLQYNDPALGAWVNMSEEAYPGRMNPITNPQATGEDGRFAWDTAAGQYRVIVSRPGFETATSRTVTVPPAVTDLHVGLTPTDHVAPSLTVSGVTYGETYTEPVNVQFHASDDVSGVRFVSYKLDNGQPQKVNGSSGTIPVSAVGAHTIDFTVADHAGNEFAKKVAFTIKSSDSVAPVTTLTANPATPNGANGWYTSNVTVSLSAVDNPSGSGVDKIRYRLNGGAWNEYTAPFALSTDGIYAIDYFSTDKAGNSEAAKTGTVKLDKTLPVTKYNLDPVQSTSSSGRTYISGFKVTLTPTDNQSTVTGTVYRINGSSWQPYSAPFEIQAATAKTVEYYSTDGAGNKESINLMDFIRGIFTGNK
ncbi:carboxypeptidase-like regulatory domain-containing protein [Paenibacillus hamazuiensis]|uniref:carboxypeptidase-like regulatory domain-containing protein n=1 Tax=Paenibacillus hamazuiensis TaxID=2936508 RepID=UPI00200E0E52|nr:carboxypeptidase-like regulatory domain-containing protein [Paenibacillus hamazuiensis]